MERISYLSNTKQLVSEPRANPRLLDPTFSQVLAGCCGTVRILRLSLQAGPIWYSQICLNLMGTPLHFQSVSETVDGLCLRSALLQLTVHLCLTLRSTRWQSHRVCFGVYSPPPTAELTQVNVCLVVTLSSVSHSRYPHYSWASQASAEEPSFCLLISFCNIIQESYSIIKSLHFFQVIKWRSERQVSGQSLIGGWSRNTCPGCAIRYVRELTVSPCLGPPVPVPDVMWVFRCAKFFA